MARPRVLTESQVEALKSLVQDEKCTPAEVAKLFRVSRMTAYNYLRALDLPIYRSGAHLKFYDPSWDLPHQPCPRNMEIGTWGEWVSTSKVPPSEAHPAVWKRTTSLPLAAMILAEKELGQIPPLLSSRVRFKDSNFHNLDPENLEYVPPEIVGVLSTEREMRLSQLMAERVALAAQKESE